MLSSFDGDKQNGNFSAQYEGSMFTEENSCYKSDLN